MNEENKAVAKTTTKKPAVKGQVEMNYPALFEMAMSNERGLDIIKELTALKNSEEDRLSKKDYELHFSEMQGKFEPIERKKEGYNFKYADLPMMEKKYRPIISNHGFSYKWTAEPLGSGAVRYRIHISGYGWTDSDSFFDVPKIEAGKMQNSIQAAGSVQEYGRRQSFKLGFGVSEIGEDTDGDLSFEDGVKYGDMYLQFEECKTVKDAHDLGQNYYREGKAENNNEKIEMSKKLYAKRKAELNG